MKKDKKGWLRIMEAFIAIVLVASVLVLFYVRSFENPRRAERVYEVEKAILEEISLDNELRAKVLENNEGFLRDYSEKRVAVSLPGFDFGIRICEPEEICQLENYNKEKEVYASERLISSILTKYEPKKIKIFVWRK